MPYCNVLQSDGFIELPHGLLVSFGRNDVVTGNVGVAGINACHNRNHAAQSVEQLSHLLERAAERVLGPGGVLDRDLQAVLRKLKTVGGATDGVGGGLQSDL